VTPSLGSFEGWTGLWVLAEVPAAAHVEVPVAKVKLRRLAELLPWEGLSDQGASGQGSRGLRR
jgi:hypothetical protein